MENYFHEIEEKARECYEIARRARKKGYDPKKEVEISFAKDLADRVEELVGPKGIAQRIRKYLKEKGREETALQIAVEIAEGMEGDFASIIEQAVRTGLAILTEGVLVAPIEGISSVEIGKNADGSRYVDLYFAGPIRSAGGTGEAMSVLIADLVRRKLGIERYKPTEDEIERYKEEIPLYDRITHLQYLPSPEEIEIIIRNCPVCINGEATEDREVMGKRDLPRVKTNKIRGGACLVIAEGLCLKAPKLLKHVTNLKLEGWNFLRKFLYEEEEEKEIVPSDKYVKDLIAGRPVLSHPSRKGGFRLRYGRGRTCGLAATAMNPATMYLLDEFIAIGTQLKTERPGKGTIATPCDSIEGPMVLLDNGDFVQVNSVEEAKKIAHRVKEIVDLGEILIPFGEFVENNAILPPASYCYEWWIQELREKADEEEVRKKYGIENFEEISFEQAFNLAKEYDIPLHPSYNLFWHDISKEELNELREAVKNGIYDGKLYLEKSEKLKEILLKLGVLHKEREEYVIEKYADVLLKCCGFEAKEGKIVEVRKSDKEPMEAVQEMAGIKIMPKSLHRIGARMGRPEKAAERKMKATPHLLFPVGSAGGKERLLNSAKKVEVEMGERKCERCGRITYKARCECGGHAYFTGRIKKFSVDVSKEMKDVEKNFRISIPQKVKGVIGLSSHSKTPESLEKGVLRAKHGVYVFKDGTARFDMTNMPLTHFKPYEIGTSVEKLHELGYEHDYLGNKLERDDQICEIKPQDIIPSRKCGEYFVKVAKFLDEMLEKIYGIEPYYKVDKAEDLIGHLVVGLSPHTSAGVIGRIIGFVDANVCCAHPFFHAAKRRNCDGDEDALMLLIDVLINFSKEYIPEKRGGKMDLPLVIATRISPSEIDKEALNLDVLYQYPLEFYRKTLEYPHPKELEEIMDLVASRLGTEKEYSGFGFTHDTENVAKAPKTSAYKLLNKMEDKLKAQLGLAVKLRAVDEKDVANRVIQTHFLPDLMGNLRAFTRQQFRCVKCNTKYRRVPLRGVCVKCGNSLTLTVHEKSIKKYLEPAKQLLDKFNVSDYTKQRLVLFEKFVDSIFKNDKVKDTTLTDFL
ncbi:MAG: DNA polymerase II large subunit [Thermoplasmata archaeon]|nr:MAG: DNA polymerase II large subunit [Thermoplasmata archaeon]